MNTERTGNGALIIDNREEYRRRLIASRQSSERRYNLTEPFLSVPEALGLTLFAAGMLVLLAEAISWGLR